MTLRLSALARGALLTGHPWLGTIVSIHERALNILRGDGLVVSVVADEGSMTAMSVLVPPLFDPRPGRSLSSQASSCDGSRIWVGEAAEIDLSACPEWTGLVASLRSFPTARAARLLRQVLGRFGKPGGLVGVLRQNHGMNSAAPHLSAAREALEAGRLEGLVGLGPGLTPSGDDFLTGVLLAASISGRNRPGTLPLDTEKLRTMLAGTTPAGRTLLWMALLGHFPAFLVRFAEAFAERGMELQDAVRDACAYGESSGTDALAGFCWAAARAARYLPSCDGLAGALPQ